MVDDGDFRTHERGDRREFHRDDARAHEGDALGEDVDVEEIAAVVDELVAGDAQAARALAGAEHDVVGRDALSAGLDGVRVDQRAMAAEDGHAHLGEHAFEHRVHGGDDLLFVGH